MDPASRILLEMTNEAISDAGYHPSDFEGSNTGVFMGFSISETEIHEMFNELTPAAEIITG